MPLPNEIQQGRFQRVLQRMFNLQSFPPAPQLAEEIVPVFQVEAPKPEQEFLIGTRLCSASVDVGAVAVKRSVVRIRNPESSNQLVIVEQAIVSMGVGDIVLAGLVYSDTDIAQTPAAGSIVVRDTRDVLTAQPTAHFTFEQGPPTIAPGSVFMVRTVAGSPVLVPIAVVLAPGTCLEISALTVNLSLTVTLAWRERAVLPMEFAL